MSSSTHIALVGVGKASTRGRARRVGRDQALPLSGAAGTTAGSYSHAAGGKPGVKPSMLLKRRRAARTWPEET